MEIKRFFVTPDCLVDNKIYLTGMAYKHLGLVLRAKVGYKVIICLNNGKEYNCTIEKINSNTTVLNVDNIVEADKRNKEVTLYAAILKNSKLDYVVQKAVELGVAEFYPFISQRCADKKFNLERARVIALESAQQCGSSFLTNIHEPITFDEVIKKQKDYDTSLIAYECENKDAIKDIDIKGNKIALIVGPEGGFEQKEVQDIVNAGSTSVTLGKRILRADTAGIVFPALVLNEIGELDYED